MIQRAGVRLPVQGTWVQSLAGDLGPYTLQGNGARVLGATQHRGSYALRLRPEAAR